MFGLNRPIFTNFGISAFFFSVRTFLNVCSVISFLFFQFDVNSSALIKQVLFFSIHSAALGMVYFHPPFKKLIEELNTKKSFIFIIAIVKQTSSKWKYTDSSHWYGGTTSTSPPQQASLEPFNHPPVPPIGSNSKLGSGILFFRGQIEISHFHCKNQPVQ